MALRPVVETNEVGDPVEVKRASATVPARIEMTKGGEEVIAGRMSGMRSFVITVRSTPTTRAISTGDTLVNDATKERMNVQWNGDLEGRGRFQTIHAEAGGPNDG
ncbi:head-tail adaptor protein [Brevundimonas sp. M1A4_2e]